MLKRVPGTFKIELYGNQRSIDEIKIFLIPGEDRERSLMVDTGFRSRTCLHATEKALEKLEIIYGRPDMFLTHRHHNRCGLASEYMAKGVGLFMNPQEDRHCYDRLYYSHSHGSAGDQSQVLQSVGMTENGAPEIWNMFMEVSQRIRESRGWGFEIPGYFYMPVSEGRILGYGDYDLETVGLKGHTYGQMGPYDRDHKTLFCAGQATGGIMPIMGTIYPDEHLLKGYFDSLERLKHQYVDCLIPPTRKEPIRNMKRVVDRIVFAYLDKTGLIKHTLGHGHYRMTTKEVACLAYNIDHVPRDQPEFIKLKMVISKIFSCLGYLYDEGFATRTLENGTYYREAP